MKIRALAAAALTAAGLVAAVPSAAHADGTFLRLHASCRSNANHYTAADFYVSTDSSHQMYDVAWNTDAAFRADRITWAAWDGSAWVLLGAVGGSSTTHADVDPSGSDVGPFAVAAHPTKWRLTVFDASWGDCQGSVSL